MGGGGQSYNIRGPLTFTFRIVMWVRNVIETFKLDRTTSVRLNIHTHFANYAAREACSHLELRCSREPHLYIWMLLRVDEYWNP